MGEHNRPGRPRLRLLPGGRKEARMSNGPRTETAQPKLTADQLELVKWLRADTPGEPVRFAECKGTPAEPHDRDLYLGFFEVGVCGSCARELPTEILDLKQLKGNGGNGGNGGKK